MSDYSVAQCEAQRLEIACLQREIERLRAALSRVAADVELWHVLDSHWSCGCSACEDLESIAAGAGGDDE